MERPEVAHLASPRKEQLPELPLENGEVVINKKQIAVFLDLVHGRSRFFVRGQTLYYVFDDPTRCQELMHTFYTGTSRVDPRRFFDCLDDYERLVRDYITSRKYKK